MARPRLRRTSAEPAQRSSLSRWAIIVMGPSGSGKSTLGSALAAEFKCRFLEGDNFHSSSNRRKMSAGIPLNDEDRARFIDSLGRALARSERPIVASCSALKRAHRRRLDFLAHDILFVWPDVPVAELRRRMEERQDHFMPANLLVEQLESFESPAVGERIIRIDGTRGTHEQVREVRRCLASLATDQSF